MFIKKFIITIGSSTLQAVAAVTKQQYQKAYSQPTYLPKLFTIHQTWSTRSFSSTISVYL